MKYSAVIFDMDGTVLNTLEDLRDSTNFALESFDYPPRSLDEVREFVGDGINMLIRRALPSGTDEAEFERVLDVFRAHYKTNMMNKTRPYDGIVGAISRMRSEGYKTAVVSNKIEPAAVELCDNMFSGMFDVVVGAVEGRPVKPAPDGVEHALKMLGVSKKDAVFTGDSQVDVQTAKNARLPCIGVTWGFRSRDEIRNAGADFIIDSPEEYFDII
ncbi:MAG: HAD-IA family hydrolase [Clostridiales bacterium]|nr:HAD-IA family hydrolase [Clostridiales bacterium]